MEIEIKSSIEGFEKEIMKMESETKSFKTQTENQLKYMQDLRGYTKNFKLQTEYQVKTIQDLRDNLTKLNGVVDHLNEENQLIKSTVSALREYETKYNQVVCEVSRLETENKDLRGYKDVYPNLMQEIHTLRSTKHSLETEKGTLLLRLSKIAGLANLQTQTYNNPCIAELRDEKRPTKLAEEFSELYDNEWTDAFDEVEGDDDEIKTRVLYNLLEHANAYCAKLSVGHDEAIQASFTTLTYIRTLSQSKETEYEDATVISKVEFEFENLSKEQKKMFDDIKKLCEIKQSPDVTRVGAKIIADEMNINTESKMIMAYISKCIDICWSMHRHAPPVYIDFSNDGTDEQSFDTKMYRIYTKSGKLIHFVVWPPIHLHEGGPLLGKGVAQGRN